jgi:tetratricopeptide (TPR) repeat protein
LCASKRALRVSSKASRCFAVISLALGIRPDDTAVPSPLHPGRRIVMLQMTNPVALGCLVVALATSGTPVAASNRTKADRPSVDAPAAQRSTEADERKHNELFKRGADLITPYMSLTDRVPKKSDRKARELREGIRLLDDALKLFPDNWSALWIQGKAFQALGEHEQAYTRFKRSYALQGNNPDVARELMLESLEVGRANEAVDVARGAATKHPGDSGLRANLALALLLAGRLDEAAATAAEAQRMDPSDVITKDLVSIISEVRRGKRPRPRHVSDLQN